MYYWRITLTVFVLVNLTEIDVRCQTFIPTANASDQFLFNTILQSQWNENNLKLQTDIADRAEFRLLVVG